MPELTCTVFPFSIPLLVGWLRRLLLWLLLRYLVSLRDHLPLPPLPSLPPLRWLVQLPWLLSHLWLLSLPWPLSLPRLLSHLRLLSHP